jgi:hypothetical protein
MPTVTKKKVPREALRFGNPDGGFVEFSQADDENKFRLHGYTGAAMDNMFFGKVIVDVQGVNLQKAKRGSRFSILREHNPYRILGAGTVSADDKGIWVDGSFSMASRDGKEIAGLLADGVPLQASISIDSVKGEEVSSGESTEVNGKTVKGPVFVARKSRLREVSIVSLGADANTSAIAAADGATEEVVIMNKELEMAKEEKPVEAVEEVVVDEDALRAEGAASVRAEFAALCKEFGEEFGLKMFKAGTPLEDAKDQYLAHLKEKNVALEEEVAKFAAKPDEAELKEPVKVGHKKDEEAPKSFKAAWESILAERNRAGENLKPHAAMKIAMSRYPDLDIRS